MNNFLVRGVGRVNRVPVLSQDRTEVLSIYPLDILWQVFHVLTVPVPYTFVSINRRKSEVWAHIAIV